MESVKPLISQSTLLTVATVVSEVVGELTSEEAAQRNWLEFKVERAFYEAGKALAELRDRRLYRSTHRKFEDYCLERFGMRQSRLYQLIDAAKVLDNLLAKVPQFVELLPTNESQCRPLTGLEPQEQCEVWQEAVVKAGGKVPNGRLIKDVVERLKEQKLLTATGDCHPGDAGSGSCRPGNVYILTGLKEHERKYNGCWAIVRLVDDSKVEVDVHNAILTLKRENLKPIDSPDTSRQILSILKRIRRLGECDLDRGAYPILESLGRQTHLTDLEEKLLTFLEQQYGINLSELSSLLHVSYPHQVAAVSSVNHGFSSS